MKSINQLNKATLEGRRVIVRGDLDVPIQAGMVKEASRLDAISPTLEYLTLRGACVILIGHMGRPEGKVDDSLRLNPVAGHLSRKFKVKKVDSVTGIDVKNGLELLAPGEVLLVENLRFDPREEANDQEFARELSTYGEIFVNECFSTCHRAHASISGVTAFLDSYAGLRLELELENITRVLESPDSPFVVILGGVKLETKLPVISRFLSVADYILLGGKIGSAYEGDNNYKVLGPVDYVGEQRDIGPKTIQMFKNVIKVAKTVVWNGPLGQFELPDFIEGTKQIANAVVESKAYSLVGGGDTIDALVTLKLKDKMSFVSMGGGAMLDFISGKRLPGLEALEYYG